MRAVIYLLPDPLRRNRLHDGIRKLDRRFGDTVRLMAVGAPTFGAMLRLVRTRGAAVVVVAAELHVHGAAGDHRSLAIRAWPQLRPDVPLIPYLNEPVHDPHTLRALIEAPPPV
jgi:hypothetical protein